MKRVNQLKVLLTDEEMAQIKAFSELSGVSMSDAVRNAILIHCVPGTVQVQDKVHSDPVLDWLALCERYPDLKRMYDLIINEHSPSLYKLSKTVEQHGGAIQELYKRSVLE